MSKGRTLAVAISVALFGVASLAAAASPPLDAPKAFDVDGRTTILALHAEGAQIYECKLGADGRPAWSFREPIATLIKEGQTVGRHYAGPRWELADGDMVRGRPASSLPGATPNDAPLLKLDVVESQGSGPLSAAKLVLRLNTHGGGLQGACAKPGDLQPESYSADYVFLR